jgi:SNF2 family DNA or RNA helicase
MASVDKLVVWAYHRDVIESLNNALVDYWPVMLHGGTSPKARQIAIDSFQNDRG